MDNAFLKCWGLGFCNLSLRTIWLVDMSDQISFSNDYCQRYWKSLPISRSRAESTVNVLSTFA